MRFRSVLLVVACFVGLVFAQGSGLLGAFGQTVPSTTTNASSASPLTQSTLTAASTTLAPTTTSSTAAPATTAPSTTPPPTIAPPTVASAPTTTTAPAAPEPTVVARATGAKLPIFTQAGDPDPHVVLTGKTEFGTPRTLVATAQRGDWWRVLLPMRPNGSQGWVRSSDVSIDRITDAIFVDISARTLTWARGGKMLLETTVAVGSPVSPTPKGYFFVTDVISTDPKSDYGAWVLALNGHSDAFTEFRGGDARIAIHGTDDPSSIGRAVSFGCVRVPPEPLAKLAAGVPIGTPVLIEERAA